MTKLNDWYKYCDKCGKENDISDFSGYCSTCRAEYQNRVASNYETRPIGETREQFNKRNFKNVASFIILNCNTK
jgi:uncharacterized membrane protein YvbJ